MAKGKIASEKDYEATMARVDALMKKGDKMLTAAELKKLRSMAEAAEAYEHIHYPLPMPKTIGGMIELKMFERKIKQNELARLMGLATPKLSQILNGKRPPDVKFLKAAYKKLHIDPAFLLDAV